MTACLSRSRCAPSGSSTRRGHCTDRACASSPSSTRATARLAPEELRAVAAIVERLLGDGRLLGFADRDTNCVTLKDILVVAPYNAQVRGLRAALPDGARIGTVDKFQGQEAPIVLFSMTNST